MSGDPFEDVDAALAEAFGSPEVAAFADPRRKRNTGRTNPGPPSVPSASNSYSGQTECWPDRSKAAIGVDWAG